jgi:hypothetical protein
VLLHGRQHEIGRCIQALALEAKMGELAGVALGQNLPATLADCVWAAQPGDGRALG